ncbi:MAG TPA: hypothetical protein VHO06_01675 [Polyangia bacterium]|nr:hypothetical protein [Polyangia bacterium]
MFRLIKLGITLMGLAAFAWFGVTVKLGSQTLFQHLRAIGQTKASQDLVDGTRAAAGPLVDGVRRRFHEGTAETGTAETGTAPTGTAEKAAPDAGGGPPEERVSAADRQALRHLIRRVDR